MTPALWAWVSRELREIADVIDAGDYSTAGTRMTTLGAQMAEAVGVKAAVIVAPRDPSVPPSERN